MNRTTTEIQLFEANWADPMYYYICIGFPYNKMIYIIGTICLPSKKKLK